MSSRHNVFQRALFNLLVVLPIACSVFAGFVVVGRQCREWVELGYWPTIALHDALNWWIGRPISTYRMESDLLELIGFPEFINAIELVPLDKVLRCFLDSVPLALWLIAVIPTIWFWLGARLSSALARQTPKSVAENERHPSDQARGTVGSDRALHPRLRGSSTSAPSSLPIR
jgi:hypothetical protein